MSFTPFYPVMPLYDHSFPHFLPWSCREPEADSWISLPLLILYAFLGFICFRCCLIPSAGVTASADVRQVQARAPREHFFVVAGLGDASLRGKTVADCRETESNNK